MRGGRCQKKKVLAKITERLQRFEEYEVESAAKLLSMKESYNFDDEILEMAGSIRRKEYINKPGDLAVLYEAFLEYSEKVDQDNRNEPEFMDRKYWLYIEAVKDKSEYPKGLHKPGDYLQREALFVMSDRHKAGEERYSDLFNAKMMIDDCGSEIRFCGPWKKWVIWDGSRWKRDDGNLIYHMAMDTIKEMYNKALLNKTTDEILAMIEHTGRSESVRKIEAMVLYGKKRNFLCSLADFSICTAIEPFHK